MAGTSSRPSVVNEYSTDGGDVGMTLRVTTPLSSNSCNRPLSTFAEIKGMSLRNSLKRRGSPLRYQMTLGVHAPPRSAMHSVKGQAGIGGGTLLFRLLSVITKTFRFPVGYLKMPVTASYGVSRSNRLAYLMGVVSTTRI
jgi:hypothetical protein